MLGSRKAIVVILIGMFLYWYLDTPLPEDMPQKWKVRVIDATMRTYGHVMYVLMTLGVATPTSYFGRWLADVLIITMATGRPWVSLDDPALFIKDIETEKNRIQMRIYEPKTTSHVQKRPVLVYFHGGGFSQFSIDVYDPFTRHLSKTSGIVVVSVNYRLSPQYPYPAPQNDCIEAVEHIISKASELRIDTERIAVGGDSAGGNLAASVSLRLKKKIKLQLLLVPALQFFTYNTTSVIENRNYFSQTINSLYLVGSWTNYIGCCEDYLFDIMTNNHTSQKMKTSKFAENVNQEKWMMKHHTNTDAMKHDLTQTGGFGRDDLDPKFEASMTNPFICPLMADIDQMRDLPRAYVMTAGYDLIRDEGIMYAARLKHAGVPTELINHRTTYHSALVYVTGPLRQDIGGHISQGIVNFLQFHL